MRFGILTYHYVYNEGAIWQAFSLCDYLRKRYSEHHFDIINYRHARKYQSIVRLRSKDLVQCYDRTLNEYLGECEIESDDHEELFDILPDHYDGVIVGSDIIWQVDHRRSLIERLSIASEKQGSFRPSRQSLYAWARDVKNHSLRVWRMATGPDPRKIPYPNAYWLSPSLPVRKATYAASVGYSDSAMLSASQKRMMGEYVGALDFISVRDQATNDFLHAVDPELAGRALYAPDPAWLFDEPLPDVLDRMERAGVPCNEPLAGVLIPRAGWYGAALTRWVIPELKAMGYKIVSIIDANPAVDFNLAQDVWHPFEWWSVIRSLDCLVTVRTHPSIAALKYGTKLFNVDITAMLNRSRHSKSCDMMQRFNLDDHVLFTRDQFNEQQVRSRLSASLTLPWDWPRIEQQILNNRSTCELVVDHMMKALTQ